MAPRLLTSLSILASIGAVHGQNTKFGDLTTVDHVAGKACSFDFECAATEVCKGAIPRQAEGTCVAPFQFCSFDFECPKVQVCKGSKGWAGEGLCARPFMACSFDFECPNGELCKGAIPRQKEGLCEQKVGDVVAATDDAPACWIGASSRGAGNSADVCPDNLEQSGLLCYPPCQDGYKGVGPMCWQMCPGPSSGKGQLFRDDGAFCGKEIYYGRGIGHLTHDACLEKESNATCEKCLLLWYPQCASDTYLVPCNICAQYCPEGMADVGASCHKNAISRGLGEGLICPADREEDGGLCYPPCKDGTDAVGPVCWNPCPKGYVGCGGLLCVAEGAEEHQCTGTIRQMVKDVGQLVIDAARKNGSGVVIDLQKLAQEFTYPACTYDDSMEIVV